MGRIASLDKVLAVKAKATTASFCRPCMYDNNRNVRSYRQALCPGVNEVASTLLYVSTANSRVPNRRGCGSGRQTGTVRLKCLS